MQLIETSSDSVEASKEDLATKLQEQIAVWKTRARVYGRARPQAW